MMRRRRSSSDDVQIIDDSPPSFVDLTEESPASTSRGGQTTRSSSRLISSEIVDLTCTDTPPVVLQPVRSRRTRHIRQARLNSPYSSSSDITIDSDGENEVVHNEIIDLQISPPVSVNRTLPWTEHAEDMPPTEESPCRKEVKCPVCMESETRIRANGLRLTSTICGHIFCNQCIRSAIGNQHRCPTCRTKLTMRQIHPIFL
ncbi:E3 ubiquitin-protein ligase RNF4-like [Asterias rubens]|uniref:E3 ubiquitin-protein ligase RNF4-like n=1 Tax=Asterias rubens TaxID=7604 RepID=UPI001454F0EC|nr:E3 ubiquitin-protein ligase RNF4-like [Asterias rubens]XP_033633552.1 E3 ubiquitin-protein ligase RNF4-like [Asterias rubens]